MVIYVAPQAKKIFTANSRFIHGHSRSAAGEKKYSRDRNHLRTLRTAVPCFSMRRPRVAEEAGRPWRS